MEKVDNAKGMYDLDKKIETMLENGVTHFKIGNYHPVTTNKTELAIFDDNFEYLELEKKLKRKYKNKIAIDWPPLLKRQKHKKKCTMSYNFIHVNNLGDIGACCMRPPNSEIYGNIYDQGEAWNTPYFQKLRSSMRDEKSEPIGECRYCESLSCDLYEI